MAIRHRSSLTIFGALICVHAGLAQAVPPHRERDCLHLEQSVRTLVS